MDALLASDSAHIAKVRGLIGQRAVVSVADFARLTGTSEGAIVRAWKDGGIPCAPGGCVPVAEGVVALVAIPGALRRGSKIAPAWLADLALYARRVLGLPDERDVAADDDGGSMSEIKRLRLALLKSQAAQNLTGAKKKEFELQLKKGEYVKTAEVELDAAEAASNVIAVLRDLPARIGAACAGLSADEIERRATAEINRAVDFIQNAAFTGDWGS